MLKCGPTCLSLLVLASLALTSTVAGYTCCQTINGMRINGYSTVNYINVNGTIIFGINVTSNIPISHVLLSYTRTNGVATNATMSLARGNSTVNGWWFATVQPRATHEIRNVNNGVLETYSIPDPFTIYATANNGDTATFPLENTSGISSFHSSVLFPAFSIILLLVLATAAIIVALATVLVIVPRLTRSKKASNEKDQPRTI